jgi:magnesium transporter
MIHYFGMIEGVLRKLPTGGGVNAPAETMWIDLLNPTDQEEAHVEGLLQLEIPTRKEMEAIGDSSRLYEDRGALFMTTAIVTGIIERRPSADNVTFVLVKNCLVTVRYSEPHAFRTFEAKCAREPGAQASPDRILVALLENLINRIAEVWAEVEGTLEATTAEIFAEPNDPAPITNQPPANLQSVIKRLGKTNALLAKLRESLLSLNRALLFLRQGAGTWLHSDALAGIDAMERDLASLTEYEAHMVGEISFLLNSTLGLINIDQNQIIKVFSIASVLFLPPTMVGTIYGMNFEVMPELKWAFGYPLALTAMIVSAIIPYWIFKRRGWL